MTLVRLKVQAENLTQAAVDARAASAIALERQQYEDRLTKLESARALFIKLSDVARMLFQEGCVSREDVRHDSQSVAVEVLRRFSKRYERDRYALLKGESFATLITQLENTNKHTSRRLQNAWQAYVSTQTRSVRTEELEWLRLRAPKQVLEITEARAFLQSAARNLPSSASQVDAVRNQVERLERAWRDAWYALTGADAGNLPRGAKDFLQAVGRPEGASLDLLTSEVLTWLRTTPGLSESFKITLK